MWMVGLMACGGAPDGLGDTATSGSTDLTLPSVPEIYEFTSRFSGESSVAYSGQAMRQVLMADLAKHVGDLDARVSDGWVPEAGEVEAELNFYFDFDGLTSADVPISTVTQPASLQVTYGEISTSANLVGKLAGNDSVGQHRDWSQGFDGFDTDGVVSPEDLVRYWFSVLDARAVARGSGVEEHGPDGEVLPVHLTPEGHDLQRLLANFLHGAISFSQTADDYLDDDEPGKGLLSDHSEADDGAPYTALEHAWDEGFGYFGGSRDFGLRGKAAVASSPVSDSMPTDAQTDLTREINWPMAVHASQRDVEATVDQQFARTAWDAFIGGRHVLAESGGPLSDSEMVALRQFRDDAVGAYEAVFAATAVHYINGVLVDMGRMGTDDYSFELHSANWSEMKGMALALQFNSRSPMSDTDFVDLHALLGMELVGSTSDSAAQDAYKQDLIAARALLGSVYGFDETNLGGLDGSDGW